MAKLAQDLTSEDFLDESGLPRPTKGRDPKVGGERILFDLPAYWMFFQPEYQGAHRPPAKPDCQHAKWKAAAQAPGGSAEVTRSGPGAMNPDHMHPASLSGPLTTANLKWADQRVNSAVGGSMKKITSTPETMSAHKSCNCT